MPDHVGERLLDDAVHREAGRAVLDLRRRQIDHQLDRETGVAHPGDQSRHGGETGQRCQCLVGGLVPQDAEHRAQLGQGQPARLLDRLESGTGPSCVGSEPQPLGPGLHHHHGHRVGDDVVQLAGDPVPLPLGTLGGLDLEQRRPPRVVGGQVATATYERASRPGPRPQHPRPEILPVSLLRRQPGRNGECEGGCADDDRVPAAGPARRAVEHDEQGHHGQLRRERSGGDHALDELGGGHDDGHRPGTGGAPRHRYRDHDGECHERNVRGHVGVRHDLAHEDDQEESCERGVGPGPSAGAALDRPP